MRYDPAANAAAREHGLALNAAALAQLDEHRTAMAIAFPEPAAEVSICRAIDRRSADAAVADDWLSVEP